MKLILLTGATGFVGGAILKTLISQRFHVRVILRKGSEHLIETSPYIESLVSTKDMFSEDEDWWKDACSNIDTIIHAAWYAKPSKYLQSRKNINCLIGTISMAMGAIKSDVRRFVGIGTCFEYDVKAGFLSIDTPLRPSTLYAASKVAAYNMLTHLFLSHGIEFLWCRLFYLYGEGEDSKRLYSYIHKQLAANEKVKLTSGNQVRDYLSVKEASEEIVHLSIGQDQGPINICSGIPVTVRSFAEKIASQYNRLDLLEFNARPNNLTDPICVVGIKKNEA